MEKFDGWWHNGKSQKKSLENMIFRGFQAWMKTCGKSGKWDMEVSVGQSPVYDDRIAASRKLTMYRADAFFFPDESGDLWVVEVEPELNNSAVGQALAYDYAFNTARFGDYDQMRESSAVRTRSVVRQMGNRSVVPTIICLVAPIDYLAICKDNKIMVFNCREGHVSPRRASKVFSHS